MRLLILTKKIKLITRVNSKMIDRTLDSRAHITLSPS